MATRISITSFASLIFSIVFLTASCEDEKCGGSSSRYQYLLEVKVNISPAAEEYRVGDTLDFSVLIPRMILDRNHDVIETISDQSLQHLSFVNRVDSIETNSMTDEFLELVDSDAGNPRFENVGRSVYIVGEYVENTQGDWELNYTFVLKRRGVYFFRLGGFFADEVRGGEIRLVNECGNGRTGIFHEMNDGANNNWQLLCQFNENYCTQAWDETVRDRTFDQHAGYVFKVTE